MAVQSRTLLARTKTRCPRRGRPTGLRLATSALRIALPACIAVASLGTALANPSQMRPAADVTRMAGGATLRARLSPTAAFARTEALARPALGSICAGCGSAPSRKSGPVHASTASARFGTPTGNPAMAARERNVMAR